MHLFSAPPLSGVFQVYYLPAFPYNFEGCEINFITPTSSKTFGSPKELELAIFVVALSTGTLSFIFKN
jgi:hypothetical protein